jgi:hypothetical protein
MDLIVPGPVSAVRARIGGSGSITSVVVGIRLNSVPVRLSCSAAIALGAETERRLRLA